MIFFSFVYTFLDDSNFAGVNKVKEIVKEEVIKDKVKKEITEEFTNFNDYNNIIENYKNKKLDEKQDEAIGETTRETEIEVKNEELDPENVKPNIITKYINRLYFSIITGCLLGYGDIYPTTIIAKIICAVQGLCTVGLIIS
tara:strand:- start:728 stop:1153 length:426 start_codon:yes stop_codon:yes gene_type:complete